MDPQTRPYGLPGSVEMAGGVERFGSHAVGSTSFGCANLLHGRVTSDWGRGEAGMDLSRWNYFFASELGASAALTGLVTVAISINLSRILETDHLPGRAAEALYLLTAVLSLCGFALFPDIAAPTLGLLDILLAATFAAVGWRTHRSVKENIIGSRRAISVLMRIGSIVPFAVGGALLLIKPPAGIAWTAAGVIIALAVSVINAWVLLVEIMR